MKFATIRHILATAYSVVTGERARHRRAQRAAQMAAATAEKQRAEEQRLREQEEERRREAERAAAYVERERQRRASMSDSDWQIHLAEKHHRERGVPADGGYLHDSEGKLYWFDQFGRKRYR